MSHTVFSSEIIFNVKLPCGEESRSVAPLVYAEFLIPVQASEVYQNNPTACEDEQSRYLTALFGFYPVRGKTITPLSSHLQQKTF